MLRLRCSVAQAWQGVNTVNSEHMYTGACVPVPPVYSVLRNCVAVYTCSSTDGFHRANAHGAGGGYPHPRRYHGPRARQQLLG